MKSLYNDAHFLSSESDNCISLRLILCHSLFNLPKCNDSIFDKLTSTFNGFVLAYIQLVLVNADRTSNRECTNSQCYVHKFYIATYIMW